MKFNNISNDSDLCKNLHRWSNLKFGLETNKLTSLPNSNDLINNSCNTKVPFKIMTLLIQKLL